MVRGEKRWSKSRATTSVCWRGRLLKLSPLPGLGPFKLPPPLATLLLPLSVCPPPPLPTLSSSLHLCAAAAAAAAAAAGCAIPDPDFCTGQGALTPASETLLQLLQTCHRKSRVKKKKIPIAPQPLHPLRSHPPLALTPFFDPLWGAVRLSPIPLPGTHTPTPSSSCSSSFSSFLWVSLPLPCQQHEGGGRLRGGRHSQVLQGHHPWE